MILLKHTKNQHALLIWDTFTGHMIDGIQDELRKFNITAAFIPSGCTCKIQPLDVCTNKPFKDIFVISGCITCKSVSSIQNDECAKPPSKQLVVNLVTETNKLLDSHTSMVQESFLVHGISNSLDGSQNDMIHCT